MARPCPHPKTGVFWFRKRVPKDLLAVVGKREENGPLPGWIDGYLARHGYRGEMTSQTARANRPDHLHEPVDTDPGAHGRFDDRALSSVTAADPRWRKLGLAATPPAIEPWGGPSEPATSSACVG